MIRQDFCVYAHIRQDTNDVFYIGKGSHNRVRQTSNRNLHWKRIVAKNNGFKSIIIADKLTEKEALTFEILLIKKARETSIPLCNMTNGGDGVSGYRHTVEVCEAQRQRMLGKTVTKGKKHSDVAKLKMSRAKLGKKLSPEHVEKVAASRKGRKYSEAYCKAISESLKGRKLSQEHKTKLCKPVICLTNNKEYPSVTAAAQELNLETTNISRCCKGVFKQTKGYTFQYKAITQ
jgi:hypothetical protein